MDPLLIVAEECKRTTNIRIDYSATDYISETRRGVN